MSSNYRRRRTDKFCLFTHNYKEAIIYGVIAICLREFYAKPYSILEEEQDAQFVKFKKVFGR